MNVKNAKKFFTNKKKLLLTILSVLLVVCCVGATTLAWFTSQATSALTADVTAAHVGITLTGVTPALDISTLIDSDLVDNSANGYYDDILMAGLNGDFLVPGRVVVGPSISIVNGSNIDTVVKLPISTLCTFTAGVNTTATDLNGATYSDYLDLVTAQAGLNWATVSSIGAAAPDIVFDDSTWVSAGATGATLDKTLQVGFWDTTTSTISANLEDYLTNLLTATTITSWAKDAEGNYYILLPYATTNIDLSLLVGMPAWHESQAPLEDLQVSFGSNLNVQAVQATIGAVNDVWTSTAFYAAGSTTAAADLATALGVTEK